MSDPRPLIVVTPGDPEGVGPEICRAVLQRGLDPSIRALLFVGARKPFDELGVNVREISEEALLKNHALSPLAPPFALKDESGKPLCWMLPAPDRAPKKSLFLPGYQSGWSIETATRLVTKGVASAIVTGPISKERLQKGGYLYPGHTEFLAALCRRKGAKPLEVTMMLANDQLRVSLVTTHVGLKKVSTSLTRAKIRRAVTQTVESLISWWGIKKPRIAVSALNPHAGEAGLFGKEEILTIAPEVRFLRKKFSGIAEILGPLPADTLFATNQLAPQREKYDAVVCMYHDQGLIPVKLLDFRNTVNITLGLPIVRTSVDHGVGFEIARTGRADPSSLQSAIDLAVKLVSSARLR